MGRVCVWAALIGVCLMPTMARSTSLMWVPPFANVVTVGGAVVVAYDAGGSVVVRSYKARDGSPGWTTQVESSVLARDMCASRAHVYVATQNQGVYVLDAVTGSSRGRLQPCSSRLGSPLLACCNDRVLVGQAAGDWLIAYDARTLRRVWKRIFRGWRLSSVGRVGETFSVLQLENSSRGTGRQIALRPEDGHLIASQPVPVPAYRFPGYLPKAVREWCERTLGVAFGPAGQVLFFRDGTYWFIGVPAELDSIGRVYSVRSSGSVGWTRSVKGLSSMVVLDDRLIVTAVRNGYGLDKAAQQTVGEVFALNAATGRRLWTVALSSPRVRAVTPSTPTTSTALWAGPPTSTMTPERSGP